MPNKPIRGLLRLAFRYPREAAETPEGRRQIEHHASALSENIERLLATPPDRRPDWSDEFSTVLCNSSIIDTRLYGSPLHQKLYEAARRLDTSMVIAPQVTLVTPLRDVVDKKTITLYRLMTTGRLAKKVVASEKRLTQADVAWQDATDMENKPQSPLQKPQQPNFFALGGSQMRHLLKLKVALSNARNAYEGLVSRLKVVQPKAELMFDMISLNAVPKLTIRRVKRQPPPEQEP